MERRAYIALGSNLADREATHDKAVMLMDRIEGVDVAALSHLIETEPVGGPAGQPKYLNGVAEVRTTLSARDLKTALHEIEAELGRDRSREVPSGPRTCDLDLLLIGDEVIDEPDLKVPHPRMHQRRFVLEPLAEIAPDLVHPVLGRTIAQLLAELKDGSP